MLFVYLLFFIFGLILLVFGAGHLLGFVSVLVRGARISWGNAAWLLGIGSVTFSVGLLCLYRYTPLVLSFV